MKPGLPAALTMIAVVGSGIALASLNSYADQSSSKVPPTTEQHVFSPEDRAAFLDARIAALHAGLKLSPDQEKLWPAVETALRTAAKNARDRFQKVKDEPQSTSLIDRLRRRGENAVARGQSLEAIADAAAPLYATLSEDQKHRLPVLMRGLRPHFFHPRFAMMGDGQGPWGWRHSDDRDGHRGFAPQEDGDDHPGPMGR
ncbi:MAG TPA: Spy/CpxP family protein refolding chaperone [Methylocella sp.]|nr:Spy/CpxP family protein refolding chaperone [Methylocella sp.]